jgi:threonine dehydrogenase-like Zn-dependent dehydrogenase
MTDISPPPLPKGWALVRVRQCGLCASDIHFIRLQFSPFIAPVAMAGNADSPIVLGHELVGTVEQAAESCPFGVGTRVVSRSGGFRNCFNLHADLCPRCRQGQYAMCQRQGQPPPAHEPIRGGGFSPLYWEHAGNLLPVPAALSDDQAMLVEPLACSLRAVLKLPPEPGQRVLVIGAGIQGLGAIHWMRHLRPQDTVTCLARHPHQAGLARAMGAADVLEGHVSGSRLAQHLRTDCVRGPGGNELLMEGFDAVIDSIGAPGTIHQALRWVRPGGQLIVLGAHLAAGKLDYSPVWFREVRVTGSYAHGLENFQGRAVQTFDLVMELLDGQAPLRTDLVTHHVALASFAQAIRLHDNKGSCGVVRVAVHP